jgi:hypothetical protein
MSSRPYRLSTALIFLCAVVAAATLLNSFQFNPDPSGDDASFILRAQHKEVHGIKVSASALGAYESRRSFGENLARYNIQPVWLSIENETDEQVAFLPITMDPDYYSPYEVSYRFHGVLSFASNRARDEFFLKRQIASIILPRSKAIGFAYGALDNGIKYAHIVIAGKDRVEIFDFALPVPGPAFVGTNIRANSIYPDKKIEELDLSSLRMTFENQGCCTTNADSTRDGDPLNLVIVESKQDPIVPFIARGWHLARQLDMASAIEAVRALYFKTSS